MTSTAAGSFPRSPEEERRKALVDYALPLNEKRLEEDLLKYRIKYDNWFKESTLHNNGAVKAVIEKLKEGGHTYEKDGALWLKATDFGGRTRTSFWCAPTLPDLHRAGYRVSLRQAHHQSLR